MSVLQDIAESKGMSIALPPVPRGRHAGDFNPYSRDGNVEALCDAGLVDAPPRLYLARAVCRKDFQTGEPGEIAFPFTGKDNANDAHWYEIRFIGSAVVDPVPVHSFVAFCAAGADPIDPNADSPMWVKIDPLDIVGVITPESRRLWLQRAGES